MTPTLTTALTGGIAVAPPGPGVFERLGDSLQEFAWPVLLVAFIVLAFVLLLSQLPRVVLVLLGFVLLSSLILSPGAWFDWISYVATGADPTADAGASADVPEPTGGDR